MSDFLPARTGSYELSRTDRRGLARLSGDASVELARVRACEVVEIAKIQAIAAVGQAGLFEVANLTAVEAALFERQPYAAPRLQYVANSAAMGIGHRVAQLDRRLG